MVPAVTRRSLLAGVAAGTLLPLAGCAVEAPTRPFQPKHCPGKPDAVTPDSLAEWLPAFERAYTWNESLQWFETVRRQHPDAEPEMLSVHVPEPIIRTVDGGYLGWIDNVLADAAYTRHLGSGSQRAEFDVSYFVSGTRFLRWPERRIDPREVIYARRPVCDY